MAALATPTEAETIDLINARKTESDDFRVQVYRKNSMTALPDLTATLDGAKAEHIVSPDTWLPRLLGGGPIFALRVFHASDRSRPLGAALHYTIQGPPREIDPKLLQEQDWNGPLTLASPMPKHNGNGALFSMPAPASEVTPRTSAGSDAGAGADVWKERIGIERERSEHRVEMFRREAEAKAREQEERIARLERRLETASAPRGPSAADTIAGVVTAITPLLQPILARVTEAPKADPTLVELLKRDNGSAEIMKSVQTMIGATAEMSATMMRNQTQMFASMREIQQATNPPQEEESIGALLAKGFIAMMMRGNPDAAAGMTGMFGAPPQAPPPAVETRQIPAAPPAPSKPKDPNEPSLRDELVAMIKAKEPAEKVIDLMFEEGEEDEVFVAELEKHGGDFAAMFAPHLAAWVLEDATRQSYVQSLLVALAKRMQADADAEKSKPQQPEAQQ